MDTSPQTAYISGKEQDCITLTFTNSKYGAVLIKSDGSLIGDSNGVYRSDENGEVRIEGLTPSKSVVVTETKAPAGFLIDTQSQTVVIQSGKTVSVTMKNQPKG